MSPSVVEAALAQMPAGVVVVAIPEGRVLLLNARAEALLGRSAETAADLPGYPGRLSHALHGGETLRGEVLPATRPDGSRVLLRLDVTPLRDAGGRVEGAVLLLTEAPETGHPSGGPPSDARLRLLTQQMPAVLWATDADLRFTLSTGAGLANVGLVPGQVVGRTLPEYFGTTDPTEPPIAAHRRALGGESVTYEATWGGRMFQAYVEPMRDERDAIVGTIGVALDITERTGAERALRFLADASVRLATSLDYDLTLRQVAWLAVPEVADWCMVDVVEADGVLRRVAVAHADPERRDLARRAMAFVPDAASDHPIARAIRTGTPELVEEVTEAHVRASLVSDPHAGLVRELAPRSTIVAPLVARGHTLGALLLTVAESGRRFGRAELALAVELAARAAQAVDNARLFRAQQAAVAARDDFLARASHELRTPLTAALCTVRLLRRALTGALAERPEELVDIAGRNLTAMTELLNDLLDASKLAAGNDPLRPETVDVARLAAEALDVVGGSAREKGVAVDSRVPAGTVAVADRIKLAQVLLNLLSNGVKFTPPGGRVWIEGESAGDGSLVLRVRDTGEGISPVHLEPIFEPFVRVEPTGTHGGAERRVRRRGTGLGLAICRQIAALHEGEIHAESAGPGLGATFTLTLPPRATPPGAPV
jgi:PAS domain S-box-containing protein